VVIGTTFVWAHLPKAAGDATLGLFRHFPEIVVSADDARSPSKHRRFGAPDVPVDGHIRVMNIRRLPSWLLSYAFHRVRGEGLATGSMSKRDLDLILGDADADGKLVGFCDGGRLPVDRWLRVEHLEDDFLDFVATVTDVSSRQRRLVGRAVKANANTYDRRVDTWFTPEEVAALYQRNPVWAAVEREVYGEVPGPA